MNEIMKLWNNYEICRAEDWGAKPLFIPFGEWPWSAEIRQRLRKEEAVEMAQRLLDMTNKGEPGIPIYQGHPDVPDVAAKYPDKGAIGWIKRITVSETGVELAVEWDRFPGKGFGWMSPYWTGKFDKAAKLLTVNWIISVGLVNNPNIRSFRLPNEEVAGCTTSKGDNSMDIEAMKKELGLPAEATEAQVMEAIRRMKADGESCAAAKAKAEAAQKDAENACGAAKKKCANTEQELAETKTQLENAKKELADAQTALANEKAEHEKLKNLKTETATAGLANEAQKSQGDALALVNEIMEKDHCDYDTAWDRAAQQKPELFK